MFIEAGQRVSTTSDAAIMERMLSAMTGTVTGPSHGPPILHVPTTAERKVALGDYEEPDRAGMKRALQGRW